MYQFYECFSIFLPSEIYDNIRHIDLFRKGICTKIMSLTEEKRELRKRMMEKMETLPAVYAAESGAEICRRVLALEEYKQASVIFCFVGRSAEIDTSPIIEDALATGKVLCVPKCISKGVMEARQIFGYGDLMEARLGLLEPGAHSKLVLPSEIDFAVAPCVTCNLKGHRLGFGGGFYDQYLAQASFFACLVCREALLCENIPMEAHDQTPNMVITEKHMVRLTD